jgi:enoyl-CoA hydratase
VAAAGAYFRAAGINNGLTASELGLSYLLPKAIGTSRAFEVMLTGRDIDAEEAERIGLVSRAVPDDDLLDTCYQMGERIASFSRPGVDWRPVAWRVTCRLKVWDNSTCACSPPISRKRWLRAPRIGPQSSVTTSDQVTRQVRKTRSAA